MLGNFMKINYSEKFTTYFLTNYNRITNKTSFQIAVKVNSLEVKV